MPDNPESVSRRDLLALVRALASAAGDRAPASIQSKDVDVHRLGGGESGAYVAILWITGFPTLVFKAGPSADIEAETRAREAFESPAFDRLRGIGLEGCSEEVIVDLDGVDAPWRAMAYSLVNELRYDEVGRYSDFDAIFQLYVSGDEGDRPTRDALRGWLRRLCRVWQSRERPPSDQGEGTRARPVSRYLPEPPWGRGLSAVLATAATFAPESEELGSFREWWRTSLSKETLAPYHNCTLLHGDARFANIFVDKEEGGIEFIDFGGASANAEGHVFRDLARFEADLLTRIRVGPIEVRAGVIDSDERQARVLRAAVGRDYGRLEGDSEDRDNRLLAAVGVLREVFDEFWRISHGPGRWRMYRWFLLAEFNRRLLWTESLFASTSLRRLLLEAVVLVKRSLSEGPEPKRLGAPGFAAVQQVSTLLGCRRLYVPFRHREFAVNERRNVSKQAALRAAAAEGGTVQLLAETGNAFLYQRGIFHSDVRHLLEAGGRLEAVVSNPYFLQAHAISAAFRPEASDVTSLEPAFTSKVEQSLSGYRDLRDTFADQIDVRIARYFINATILIAGNSIFFEPYFLAERDLRQRRVFTTFEMEFDAGNLHTAQLMREHSRFHWLHSHTLEWLVTERDALADDVARLLRRWTTG